MFNVTGVDMIQATLGAIFGKSYMERRLDLITNNLANVNTAGFKGSRAYLIYKSQKGEGVIPLLIDSYIDFSKGPLIETKNPLDLAIEGEGFFVVMTEEGARYTRAGNFRLDAEKKLVTQDGYPVVGQNGHIYLDGSDIRVESDGSVFVDGRFVDRLRIVDFEKRTNLRHAGRSLFVNSDPSNREKIIDKIEVRQGYLEGSNVNLIRELVEMISVLRAYETYSKVEQVQSERKSRLLDTLRF